MSTIVGGIDINLLLEDLALTKQRLWIAETKQECIVDFLKAILSDDDANLIDVLIDNALSDDPVDIPENAKLMFTVLRRLAKISKDDETEQAVIRCRIAKGCRGDQDPINAIVGIQNRTKSKSPRKSRGGKVVT